MTIAELIMDKAPSRTHVMVMVVVTKHLISCHQDADFNVFVFSDGSFIRIHRTLHTVDRGG